MMTTFMISYNGFHSKPENGRKGVLFTTTLNNKLEKALWRTNKMPCNNYTKFTKTCATNKGTMSTETLRFGPGSAMWQCVFLSRPGQNIICRHSTV